MIHKLVACQKTIVCSILYIIIRAGTIIARIKNKENNKNILAVELTASIIALGITSTIILLSSGEKRETT